jgi:YfiH family protein
MNLYESATIFPRFISNGFFGRNGGVSEGPFRSLNCSIKGGDDPDLVYENRRRVLESLGLEHSHWLMPKIVHSNRAIVVDDKSDQRMVAHEEADALITCASSIAVGVTYADCLPLLLSSLDGEIIAAIHAGWRGIKSGIIKNTVRAINTQFGSCVLMAAIGPAISQAGFIVTGEVLNYFKEHWPQFTIDQETKGHVDLKAIAIKQLQDNGVVKVESVGGYTDLDQERYYSSRRDNGVTGRHLAIIVKSPS